MIRMRFHSHLAVSADQLWAHATSMEGVNYELAPLVRMTAPREAQAADISAVPLGEVAFRSVLLAGGVIPFDLHSLRLVDREQHRFLERSSSLLNTRWEHEREVERDGPDECHLRDRLAIEPRLPFARRPTETMVRRIFDHRHRRLRERFGGSEAG